MSKLNICIVIIGAGLLGLASCSSSEPSPTVEIVPTVDLDSTVQALVEQTSEAKEAFELAVNAAVVSTRAAEPVPATSTTQPSPTTPPTSTPVPPTATSVPTPTKIPPTPTPTPLSQIVFSSERFFDGNFGTFQIWMMNADGSDQHALINHPGDDWSPAWSPDGTQIAFYNIRYFQDGSTEGWWVMNADGSGVTTTSEEEIAYWFTHATSPDLTKQVFVRGDGDNREIYVQNIDGSNRVQLTRNDFEDSDPAWSPDSKRIVFQSNRDGNFEIYVMDADGLNQTRLTENTSRDLHPHWSP